MDITALEQMLHAEMPLTGAMGVRIIECTPERVIVTAPLAANRNHLETAFGGSLHALATLAGYGLVWALIDDATAQVVIRESHVRYEHPVRGELRAVCRSPGEAEAARFRQHFRRKGKARVSLRSTIEDDGITAVEFDGVFVALRSA